MMPASVMELRRICEDIQSLGSSVHVDILKHVNPALLTRNGNGVFFDMASLNDTDLERIREVVDYAKGTQVRLAEHDREMFKNAQRLVSGPIETQLDPDNPASRDHGASTTAGGPSNASEGEEAFAVQMEAGCIARPPKGVLLKK